MLKINRIVAAAACFVFIFIVSNLYTQPAAAQTSDNTTAASVRAELGQLLRQIQRIVEAKLGLHGQVLGASTLNLQRDLGLGSTGADVSALQLYLKGLGDYKYPEITGYFGLETQSAVQSYQCRMGIVCTGDPLTTGYGYVGPKTRLVLNRAPTTEATAFTTSETISPSAVRTVNGTEIWIGPSLYSTDTNALTQAPDSDWEETLNTVSVFDVYWPYITRMPKSWLGDLANTLKKHNIKFAVDTNGIVNSICDQHTLDDIGEASAKFNEAAFQKMIDAGGTIDIINLDGPMRRMLYAGACKDYDATFAESAREVADYMRDITAFLKDQGQPAPQFNLIVNLPNWNYAGISKTIEKATDPFTDDYKDVFAALHKEVSSRGLSFNALIVDNSAAQPLGKRIELLERQAASYGMKIAPYINTYRQSIHAPDKTCTKIVPAEECDSAHRDWRPPEDQREQTWLVDGMQYLTKWKNTIGRNPDIALVGTWMMHPRSVLPETTFGTLSYDVLKIRDQLAGKSLGLMDDSKNALGGALLHNLDGDYYIQGWAYDPDEPDTTLYVYIYQNGKFKKAIATDKYDAGVNNAFKIKGLHVFKWDIPKTDETSSNKWSVYVPNYTYVYGDPTDPNMVELKHSPFTLAGAINDGESTVVHETFSGTDDFSGTQGQNNWYYHYDADSFKFMQWNESAQEWRGSDQFALISKKYLHPGKQDEVALRWRAPKDGHVTLTGTVKDADGRCGNGVHVKIRRNADVLWDKVIDNGDAVGKSYKIELDVKSPDTLSFVVGAQGGDNSCDSTIWNPLIDLAITK